MARCLEQSSEVTAAIRRVYRHRTPRTVTQQSESVDLQKTLSPLRSLNTLSLLVADLFYSPSIQVVMGRVAHLPAKFLGSGHTFAAFYGNYHNGPVVFKRVCFNVQHPNQTDNQQEPRIDVIQAIALELRVLTHPPLRDHANIVKLLGLGWENDIWNEGYMWPVLIVEYASGGTLAEHLAKVPNLNIADRAEVCRDVARGLSALHECGVIHGDLNCRNILVFSAEDRESGYIAKIADFGFSLLDLEEEAVLLAKSPPWNAPEWSERKPRAILAMSDIYSFGLLALQVMGNGTNPFDKLDLCMTKPGDPREMLEKIELLKKNDQILPLFESQVTSLFMDREEANLVCLILRHTVKSNPKERELKTILEILDKFLGGSDPCESQDFMADDVDAARLKDSQGLPNTESLLQSLPQRSFPFEVQQQIVKGLMELYEDKDVDVEVRGYACVEVAMSFTNGYSQEKPDPDRAIHWILKAVATRYTKAIPLLQRFADAFGAPHWYGELRTTVLTLLKQVAVQGSRIALDDLKKHSPDELYPEALGILRREYMGVGIGYFGPELLEKFTLTDVTTLEAQIESAGQSVDGIGPLGRCKGGLLHYAACYGAVDAVEILLRRGAFVNRQTIYGETPLLYACRSGHHDVAKLLLAHGADVKLGHENGDTPFHWLVNIDDEHVDDLVQAMPEDDVKALLEITAEETNYSNHIQVAFGDGPPLLWAVAHQKLKLTQLLLKLGADPFHKSPITGSTPISLAAWHHMDNCLELLLEGLQASDLASVESISPLGVAVYHSTVQTSCLTHGSRYVEAMEHTLDLLVEHGADLKAISTQRGARSVLYAAVERSTLEMVEHLLHLGCKDQVNERDDATGYTPFHEAIHRGNVGIFHLLLQHGADISVPYQDKQGALVPSIFVCVRSMREEESVVMANHILSLGASDTLSELHNGSPPFALAVEFRQYKLAKCFLDWGADIDQEYMQPGVHEQSRTLLGHLVNVNRIAEQSLSPLRFLLEPTDGNKPADFITCREQGESILHVYTSQMSDGMDPNAAQSILLYLLSIFNQKKHLEHRHMTGCTPLHSAAGLAWNLFAIEILLDHGADPNRIVTEPNSVEVGMTPLDMAIAAFERHPALAIPQFAEEHPLRVNKAIAILRRRGARRGIELAYIWNSLQANKADTTGEGDSEVVFNILLKAFPTVKKMGDFIGLSRALQHVGMSRSWDMQGEDDVAYGEAVLEAVKTKNLDCLEELLNTRSVSLTDSD